MSLHDYSRQDSAVERRLRQWLGRVQVMGSRLNGIPGVARMCGALAPLRWPDRWPGWNHGPLATLPPSQRVLAVAITVSVVLHALLLVPVVIAGLALLWRQHLGISSMVQAQTASTE